jgi:formylmethanofuran dehydrogenase subunit E
MSHEANSKTNHAEEDPGFFECSMCHEVVHISEMHIDPDDKMLCARCSEDEPYESRVSC